MTQGSAFYYDNNAEFMVSNTGYIITGNDIKYLFALLNTKLIEYCFKKFYSISIGSSGVRWLNQYIINLPIVKNFETKHLLLNLMSKVLTRKHSDNINNIETEIDKMTYKIYCLTEQEIINIENHY